MLFPRLWGHESEAEVTVCKQDCNLVSDFNKVQNHSPNEPFLSKCVTKEKSKTKIEMDVCEVLGPTLLFWVLIHMHTIKPFPVKRSIPMYRRMSFLVTDNSEQ